MKSILIICTGNSCRSQMAHGWLSHLTNDFCIYSAGTYPELVNKHAIKVMLEVGIDISKHSSNHLNEYIDIDIELKSPFIHQFRFVFVDCLSQFFRNRECVLCWYSVDGLVERSVC